ncbi:sulfite exporter TauE/SafE family protein [Pseudomonas coleopterorum]|uniref:sulfite exporter TauE/SafE family protein n=1 Tax=Pseudomonas coleopterorum TaxID=1605838 RepID=UPI002A6B4C0E|nr:sulfite exporter TauE/SafE family protein [Pseudomonas coleopterorum]MDY1016735.1 sulfite exporter TauE/SafE family protein [Pseudomonas coleopterorum]
MFETLLYIALGAAMGTLGGVFGIGGGLIAIPALGLLFGVDQQLAQGTSLVMVVPNVLLAMWRYHQRRPIPWRHALPLAVGGLVCAWLASMLASGLDPGSMRVGFVAFLLALVVYNIAQMFLRPVSGTGEMRHAWPWLGVLGGFSGVIGGFFGVGGAVLATPVLTSVFGTTQIMAQGLSLALAAPSTSVTLLTYAVHDHVDWAMGIPMAVGGLLSISWGVKIAYSLSEKVLRGSFCAFLLLCAVLLLFKV